MVEVIVISENEDSKYKDRAGLNTNLHFTLNHSADYFSLSASLSLCHSFFLVIRFKKYNLQILFQSSKQMLRISLY